MAKRPTPLRYRRLRAALLSGSVLSFLPLFVLMHGVTASSTSTTASASQVQAQLPATTGSAASNANSASSASTSQSQQPANYTRSHAS